MMNFFTSPVLELRQKYEETHDYGKITVLKKIVAVSFENKGTLPHSFDITMLYSDCNSITQVLNDIGIKEPDIYLGNGSIHVKW